MPYRDKITHTHYRYIFNSFFLNGILYNRFFLYDLIYSTHKSI